jgi:DNA repair protein RecN (Recombination protein N)
MLSAMQLEVLDELCGGEHLERRRVFARTLAEVRALETERERLGELGAARERELELLQYELDQIEQAAPVAGEHEQLVSTRARLRNLDALQSALVHAAHALAPDGAEVPGAAQLAAEAAASIEGVAGLAPGLGELAARCDGLAIEARDVACELEAQRERIESDGSDLHTVEERLAALERLMRRHGGTIESVLEHAGRARGRRDELLDADSALERVSERLREAAARMDEQCAQLRDARARAAGPLAAAVRDQLAALGMADASFEVALSPCGPSSSGADAVEFVLAPNPGVGAGPLREIASGGELSRVMLAIAAVCAGAGTPATKQRGKPGEPDREAAAPAILVFDEVDAGVGGQTGRAVGERLRAIAAWRQVLCITHLPQVASLAQRHFSIAKDTSVSPASATVLELSEQEAVAELARMLGAAEGDPVALRHAHELRQAA